MQVQVEYDIGKVRKFNIPDSPCTFDELKGDIQSRIPSLMGKVFGIQYLDDENCWVIASTDTCIREAFRCAKIIEGTAIRRMKLKTFEGCSPDVGHFQTTKRSQLRPKCLFSDDSPESSNLSDFCEVGFSERSSSVDERTRKPIYKSPLQLLIDELEDDIHVKNVELESAKEHVRLLEEKYSNPNLKIDRSKAQCGQCHMRLGHTKRNCELGSCEGPQMCNDLDKHEFAKKQMTDATSTVKNLTKDLEKLKQSLQLKKQTFENTNDTFFSKVLPYVVNTDIEKYYPVGTYGIRQLAMGAIHPDIAILDKHFRGIVPKDLENASKFFSQILEKYNKQKQVNTKERHVNPVKKYMEERGVQFPKFDGKSPAPLTTCNTPTCGTNTYSNAMPLISLGYMPFQFTSPGQFGFTPPDSLQSPHSPFDYFQFRQYMMDPRYPSGTSTRYPAGTSSRFPFENIHNYKSTSTREFRR